jgi:hypothetical protein
MKKIILLLAISFGANAQTLIKLSQIKNVVSTPTATLTGVPITPTVAANDNSTKIANTAYVDVALATSSSTLAYPLADVSTTLTTAQAIGVTFSVSANTRYAVRGSIRNAVSSTGGIKFAMTTPTLTTASTVGVLSRGSNSTNSLWTILPSDGSLTGVMNTTATSSCITFIQGTFTTGASAGVITFYYASGTSGQTSQVLGDGTYFELIKF